MPRVTISMPNDLLKKLEEMSKDNDISLSATVVKMAELGVLVTESKKNNSADSGMSDIEKHCHKLTIQMNTLMKNIAAKTLNFTQDDIDKKRLRGANEHYYHHTPRKQTLYRKMCCWTSGPISTKTYGFEAQF